MFDEPVVKAEKRHA